MFDVRTHFNKTANIILRQFIRKLKENDIYREIKPFIKPVTQYDINKMTEYVEIFDRFARSIPAKLATQTHHIFNNIMCETSLQWVNSWKEFNEQNDSCNNMYADFIENLYGDSKRNLNEYIRNIINPRDYWGFFSEAFSWCRTANGHAYWARVSYAYELLIPPHILNDVANNKHFLKKFNPTMVDDYYDL